MLEILKCFGSLALLGLIVSAIVLVGGVLIHLSQINALIWFPILMIFIFIGLGVLFLVGNWIFD